MWGVVPIFWRELEHVESSEIVAHRMVWSFLFAVLLVVVIGQWRQFKELLKEGRILLRLLVASILISINWGIYIWAVNHGLIVETAMGYFINPLINVLFGLLFFGEKLRRNQVFAVGLAVVGVGYLILFHATVPYIALILAVTFASYGAVKKAILVPATHGMAVETGLLLVPACVYLFYLESSGSGQFGADLNTDLLLILGGIVTLAPLVLFAMAAQRISMTALGMTQYIGPTLQLIIGVWMFNEPFGSERQIAFGFIWAGLLVYSIDQLYSRRRRRLIASSAGVVRVE
jgi:chloramphenicol-sensitive protein RarD